MVVINLDELSLGPRAVVLRFVSWLGVLLEFPNDGDLGSPSIWVFRLPARLVVRWQHHICTRLREAITVSETVTASPPAPEAPTPKKPRNVVGLIALIAAVVGFIFACIPGALIVGWVLLPIAFILAIVSLFLSGKPKVQGIIALIVSVVGTIVGVIVFMASLFGAVDEAIGSVTTEEVSSSSASGSTDEAEPAAATESEPSVQELVLGETAFGMDDSGYGWYAVQVTNPNDDYIFSTFSSIEVEAFDADGVLLDTGSSYGTILSGESWYVGRFLDIGSSVIDRIEVRGPTADAATHSPAAETGSFTIGEITTGAEHDRMTVSGTLTSSFAEDQELVTIDLVARDASGKIVGIETTYTDRVPAGGTAKWDVSFWEVPLDSAITAYPHL